MRTPLIFVLVVAFTGCAAPERIDMGARFFTRPIELLIEVRSAAPRFDSAPLRYDAEIVIREPASKNGRVVHLVVDGVSSEWQSFVVPHSMWWISADELIFDEEEQFGLSFLTIAQMNPRKERPNIESSAAP